MGKAGESLVTILAAIIGVAIIAVIVSKQSDTAGVLKSAGTAFSSILGAAVSPVTSSNSGSLNLPSLIH